MDLPRDFLLLVEKFFIVVLYLITKIRKLADLLQVCYKAADGNSKSSTGKKKSKLTVNQLEDNVYF